MTTRRQLVIAAGAAAFAVPLASIAQQKPMPRVGILSGRSRQAAIDTGVHGGFLKGMRDLGYVEGRNVHYEWRYAADQYQDLRRMADELVRLKVDVIVATGTSAIAPARQATRTIPIVMAGSSDPVGSGFVASLGRPGGNVTGLTSIVIEATAKRLELLVAAIPGLSSLTDIVRRAATHMDRILKGAKPGELPVEQPTTFELVINLRTAKSIGLAIPKSMLVRADKVIE